MNTPRRYSMTVRGANAAATRQRVLEATRELFAAESGAFTLEEVASAAGTSVQTVLRAYGNKEALMLAAIGSGRSKDSVVPDPPPSAAEAVGAAPVPPTPIVQTIRSVVWWVADLASFGENSLRIWRIRISANAPRPS
jgi:hypothetical protein